MMHTVDNTTSTSATLPNLQCNTKYTILIYYVESRTGHTSVSRMVSLPARGMCMSDFSPLGHSMSNQHKKTLTPTDLNENGSYTVSVETLINPQ